MLTIKIPGREVYDEETFEFYTVDDVEVELEHSLLSLSKWEAEFEKPFLTNTEKTQEEALGYVKAMILTPNLPEDILDRFTQTNMDEINAYINKTMSATTFRELQGGNTSSEQITSELIYYWMFTCQIDIECERWHLNRLFTTIKVFGAKNGKQKKLSKSEIAAQNRALNAERRAQMGTSG